MSNTVIQIKRSLSTSQPPSLSVGELAYSYQSNTAFIGTPDGTGVIAIGGKSYLDLINTSFGIANAAYNAANGAGSLAVINLIFSTANSGYDTANAAFGRSNSIYDLANAAFDKANSDIDSANASNAYAETIGAAANNYAGFMANAANSYASATYATQTTVATNATSANNYAGFMANAANAYAASIGASANNYAGAMANSSNGYAVTVGDSANAYARVFANSVGVQANNWANTVGTSGNAYAVVVGASGNAYANLVGDSANNYAGSMANAANAHADSTYVKLSASSQTINGNVSISGNFSVVGNAYFSDTTTVNIGDPLLYIASNNYSSDVVDIGIVGNYNNGSANVHTGVYRDAGSKEWYVFQGYDVEPIDNVIDPTSHNFALAVLNADIRTSNLNLGGANAIVWIGAAFDKANAANVLAYNTGIGANAYASSVGTSANAYASAVGVAANAYADAVGTAANTNAANGSYISTGIVKVGVGGTGVTSFTTNGIVFGNNTGDLKVTAAGTEGQVLQASSTGVPQFGMLDGGSF